MKWYRYYIKAGDIVRKRLVMDTFDTICNTFTEKECVELVRLLKDTI